MKVDLLSFQQQRVRLLEQRATSSPYQVRAIVDVHGAFDADRLQQVLQRTVADVPELRSALDSAMSVVSPTRARWSLNAPAMVADEHALRLIVYRAVSAYRGVPDAEQDGTPKLAYADYAEWQQALMDDPDAATARAYWGERPSPDASRFRLPFAREVKPPFDFTPAALMRQLDGHLTDALKRLAREARVDLATCLLTAFQILLWRHLDGPGVQVGVRLDGRAHPALRDVIGACARYVPVDVDVAHRSSLAEMARRTAAIVREHRAWQDCFSWDGLDRTGLEPGEIAYHAFGFDWTASRSHLVGGLAAGRDPAFRLMSVAGTLDRFDVRLIATRVGRRVECEFEWNRCQYDEGDVAGLADRYLELLADAVRQPAARVADLEIVGKRERDVLRARARGPEDAAPADRSIHAAFEEQARLDGTKSAVVAGASRLSYADLDRRATSLAAHLSARGVRPGQRVAICLPRTPDQLVAMFGVLKAGAAFVPLDPSVPWERLAWTVADAKVSMLIAPAEAAAQVPPDAPVTLIVLDDLAAADEAHPASVAPRVDPASTAYVIYTSGSTGRPKGVLVSHRNLVHSTEARRTHYRKGVGTFLLVSPMAFDSAMAGIFWTMTSGGTLVLPGDDEHNDPAALRRLVEEHRVTHVLCLPSLYAWILETEHADALRSLQVVIVAGESCPAALTERHRQVLPAAQLHNEYGPTECSVWSTVYRAGTADERAGVPIGLPIARAEVYVAERPWRLAPRGVAAETLIGGAGVADGYLDRPDLTAERFVPDPWSARPGARVYRTGDRVRWLAGGQIEFLGRVDHQVKLRGYRIELEEIEASIGAHPDVRECAVAVRREGPGGERLVAYVVPHLRNGDAATALSDRLRRFLGERVPIYMMPGAIVTLDALPKTPNGKVDRARLPAPSPSNGAGGAAAHPPTTDTEKAIAALWQEALGRDQVGIHDNFFDLGGHSLMAIAIFARARAAMAPQLRLVDLFERPTVHALATFVDELRAAPVLDETAAAAAAAVVAEETTAVVTGARVRQQALRRKRFDARAS